VGIYLNRGIAQYKKGDYDQAIANYTRAIEINPNYAKAYFYRGLAYQDKGDYDRAIADYTKAIEINPKLDIAYNNRGLAYQDKGDYDRAIADYTKAIEINPKFDVAYYNRGSTYYKKGDHHRGIYDMQMACKLGNKNACEFLERIKSKLESDINNALRNSGLKRITAEVNDSLEVTLKGSAESISEKNRAFEIVNKFVGIKRVVDKIFVVESK
jgi:tetratricopeptide (TPR) repeat protein